MCRVMASQIPHNAQGVLDLFLPQEGKSLPILSYKLKAIAESKALMASPAAKRGLRCFLLVGLDWQRRFSSSVHK
jgi:hypothetical protein